MERQQRRLTPAKAATMMPRVEGGSTLNEILATTPLTPANVASDRSGGGVYFFGEYGIFHQRWHEQRGLRCHCNEKEAARLPAKGGRGIMDGELECGDELGNKSPLWA
ncbi:unnamed protein product [Linum trigynum]|uniref:Uncharacterized protein n=1 Tax=Linum trigynum TaxID=586398 RepID=A0AAV2G9A3_9ROSI